MFASTLDPGALFDAVRRLGTFSELADDHVASIVHLADAVSLAPGRPLFERGDADNDFFVILSGALEVSRPTPVGVQLVAQLGHGDIVGEVAFCDGLPHAATVISERASELIRCPGAAIRELTRLDARFAIALYRTLAASLAEKVKQACSFMAEILRPSGAAPTPAVASPGQRTALGREEKLAVLRELGLTTVEAAVLAGIMRAETFPPDAFIATEGAPGDILYVVVDGQARESRRFPGVGEEALAVVGRGEVFGEVSLTDARLAGADLRSHDAGCTVLSINRNRLEAVFRDRPEVGREFLAVYCRTLSGRIRSLSETLVAWRIMAAFE